MCTKIIKEETINMRGIGAWERFDGRSVGNDVNRVFMYEIFKNILKMKTNLFKSKKIPKLLCIFQLFYLTPELATFFNWKWCIEAKLSILIVLVPFLLL